MRFLSLPELLRTEFTVTNLRSLYWEWKDGSITDYRFAAREHNMIFFQIAGSRDYSFPGKPGSMTMDADSMIFIADQTHYLTSAHTENGQHSCGFNSLFDLMDAHGELIQITDPCVLTKCPSQAQTLSLFRKLNHYVNLYPPQQLLATTCVYQLLHQFIAAREGSNPLQSVDQVILPALMKMQEKPEHEYSISELCALCHISESTFRRKFKNSTGMSPVRYRNQLRVQQAKLIYDELHISIEKIAEQLGFCDAPYLCRTYKLLTGKNFGETENG